MSAILLVLFAGIRWNLAMDPPPQLHELQRADGVLLTRYFPPRGRGASERVTLREGPDRTDYYGYIKGEERSQIISSTGRHATIFWAPKRGSWQERKRIYRLLVEDKVVIPYEQEDVLRRQAVDRKFQHFVNRCGQLAIILLLLGPILALHQLTNPAQPGTPFLQVETLRARLSEHFGHKVISTLELQGLLRLGTQAHPPGGHPEGLVLLADKADLAHLPGAILRAASRDGRLRLEAMLGKDFDRYALRQEQLATSKGLFDRTIAAEVERRAQLWPKQDGASASAIRLACFLEVMAGTPSDRQGLLSIPLYREIMASLRECLRGVRRLPESLGNSLAKSMTGVDFARALRDSPTAPA